MEQKLSIMPTKPTATARPKKRSKRLFSRPVSPRKPKSY